MRNSNLTQFEKELTDVLNDVLSVYAPRELEDTIFEVFQDAESDIITDEDREKRKFLHSTIRRFFRTLEQHPNETQQLKKDLCNTIEIQKT